MYSVKSLPHRAIGRRGPGAGRRIWAYPFFWSRRGGSVTDSSSANRPHSRGSPVTIWGSLVPALSHFQERVCPAKVFCMCSPILITPRPGPPLLEAIGRRGPGGGAPDLTPPRFSTAGSRRGSSSPPAPSFSDPRPSRRISTAPLENTFAAGTPLWKCFSEPHPHDPASRTRPPFPILSQYFRKS